MVAVASIAWLRKGGIGVVNHIDSSSIWSWGIISTFTLHWDKGELEQLGGVAQPGFELLSLIIDTHQQNRCNISLQYFFLNVNKRFTAIPATIKHENHTTDDRAKILWWFPSLIRKEFEAKVSPSHEKVYENANAIFNQHSWRFFQSSTLRSSRLEVFYQKVVLNNFENFTGKHVWQSLILTLKWLAGSIWPPPPVVFQKMYLLKRG